MPAGSPAGKRTPVELQDLSDHQLILSSRQGSDEAQEHLLDRYKNFVKIKARSYFLIGADKEDLIQEGMIGLYKAIRDFRVDKQASFRAFAELCVTRQMITAIKTATRQKHIPLNTYVSLNKPVFFEDDSDRTLVDMLGAGTISDPIELVISGEEATNMRMSFAEILSELEAQVLRLYIDGKSYQEIAKELKRHVKSVDNALQRVKRKIENHLNARPTLDA